MAQTNESQEQVTVNVETLQPVTRTLMTIGALPTSYLISMTYEEQLLWLQNYLIKTVIPAINNNAEATQEVQDIVMALQDYINTQFSEMNLQEYIDNKLDEMLESGVFENILMDYVQLTKVYDTYNDMIFDASTFTNGMKLKTMGYHFINDGGGAEYVVTNVQSDNNYQISIGTNLWLELIVKDDILNVKQIGCPTSGLTDVTSYLQKAIEICEAKNIILYIPNGVYLTTPILGYPEYNLLINNSIKILGQDREKTIIKSVKTDLTNADGSKSGYYTPFHINSEYDHVIIQMENFTIDGTETTPISDNRFWVKHKALVFNPQNRKIYDYVHFNNLIIKNFDGEGLYSANIKINECLIENCIFSNTSAAAGNISGKTKYFNCLFTECFAIEHSNSADNGYLIVDSCKFFNACFGTKTTIATQFEYDRPGDLTERDINCIRTGRCTIINNLFENTEEWNNNHITRTACISIYQQGNTVINNNTFINVGKAPESGNSAINVRHNNQDVFITNNKFVNTFTNTAVFVFITSTPTSNLLTQNITIKDNVKINKNNLVGDSLFYATRNSSNNVLINSNNNLTSSEKDFSSSVDTKPFYIPTNQNINVKAKIVITEEANTLLKIVDGASSNILSLVNETLSPGTYYYNGTFTIPYDNSNNKEISAFYIQNRGSENNKFYISFY